MKSSLIVLFISLSLSISAQEKNWLSSQGCNALSSLYKYSTPAISELSNDEKHYLEAYAHFLAFIADENPVHTTNFSKSRDQLIGASNKDSQKQDLMAINLSVQYGLLQLMSGNEISGIYSIYRGYKDFMRIEEKLCNELEYIKLQALFLIFADQIESRNSVASWLFGIEGDEKKGFRLLRSYIRQVEGMGGLDVESQVLLAYCLLKFGEASDADIKHMLDQSKVFESPLLSFVSLMVAIKSRKSDEAIWLINDFREDEYKRFPLLFYAQGRLETNLLKVEGEANITAFLNTYKGQSYKADALLRLARLKHINGALSERDSILSLLAIVNPLPTAIDKQAAKEGESLVSYPICLLRARLQFDGGTYQAARLSLNQSECTVLNKCQSIEWNYRMARLEHLLQNYELAVLFYSKVLGDAKGDERYFGPYSALYAAQIAFQNNSLSEALLLIEQGRELNTGEYKHSVNRKLRELELKAQ